MPKTKIAAILVRSPSTITRDIKRNWWRDKDVPQADGYLHVTAQPQADRRRSRRRKLERLPDLRAEVIRCLQEGWSPKQITGRLRIEPAAPHRLCYETIYQDVYSAESQPTQLARLLPERRRKRKPRYARTHRSRVLHVETSIQNRPSEINDRSQCGNCGDTLSKCHDDSCRPLNVLGYGPQSPGVGSGCVHPEKLQASLQCFKEVITCSVDTWPR